MNGNLVRNALAVWGVFATVRQWWKKATCRHWHVITEGPTLKYHDNGSPYVVGRSYCADCGKGMFNADFCGHPSRAERMLLEAHHERNL